MSDPVTAVHWAHVDGDGRVVSWGTALGSDVFLQALAEGLTAVARPESVNGWDGWRLIGEEWVQDQEQER